MPFECPSNRELKRFTFDNIMWFIIALLDGIYSAGIKILIITFSLLFVLQVSDEFFRQQKKLPNSKVRRGPLTASLRLSLLCSYIRSLIPISFDTLRGYFGFQKVPKQDDLLKYEILVKQWISDSLEASLKCFGLSQDLGKKPFSSFEPLDNDFHCLAITKLGFRCAKTVKKLDREFATQLRRYILECNPYNSNIGLQLVGYLNLCHCHIHRSKYPVEIDNEIVQEWQTELRNLWDEKIKRLSSFNDIDATPLKLQAHLLLSEKEIQKANKKDRVANFSSYERKSAPISLHAAITQNLSYSESEEGAIYFFKRRATEGNNIEDSKYVKIGFTTQELAVRIAEIESSCGYQPVQPQFYKVRFAKRVEKLIHTDLELNGSKRRILHCHSNKSCNTDHREWFEISEKDAKYIIEYWCKWMTELEPYDRQGVLKKEYLLKMFEPTKRVACTASSSCFDFDSSGKLWHLNGMALQIKKPTLRPETLIPGGLWPNEVQNTEITRSKNVRDRDSPTRSQPVLAEASSNASSSGASTLRQYHNQYDEANLLKRSLSNCPAPSAHQSTSDKSSDTSPYQILMPGSHEPPDQIPPLLSTDSEFSTDHQSPLQAHNLPEKVRAKANSQGPKPGQIPTSAPAEQSSIHVNENSYRQSAIESLTTKSASSTPSTTGTKNPRKRSAVESHLTPTDPVTPKTPRYMTRSVSSEMNRVGIATPQNSPSLSRGQSSKTLHGTPDEEHEDELEESITPSKTRKTLKERFDEAKQSIHGD